MKKMSKIVLAVLIAGIFLSGVGIASAAIKLRTVTTPRGTEDVYEIAGTVTGVSTPAAGQARRGIRGWFQRAAGTAQIKDSADGTIYTFRTGALAKNGEALTVGEAVTIQGTKEARGTVNGLDIWTFTGADGKTITLRNTDGTPVVPKRESVSVTGAVTAVTASSAVGKVPGAAAETLTIRKTEGTSVLVMINAFGAKSITVAVGDTVTVKGFAMTEPAAGSTAGQTVLMAQTFTGADGKTVTLRGTGGRGNGRGFRGGMMGRGWGARNGGASVAPGSINS